MRLVNKIDRAFRQLECFRNDTRVDIMLYCLKKQRSLQEIKDHIDISYNKLLDHIKLLKEAGLIKTEHVKKENNRVLVRTANHASKFWKGVKNKEDAIFKLMQEGLNATK